VKALLCALYARVSLEDQVERFGLSSQVAALRKVAAEKQYRLRPEWEFLDDGYLGDDLARPALTKLRDLVRVGHLQVLLIYDPDRLARKLAHQILLAEEFEQAGVRLEFVTTSMENTPEGRMLFNIKGLFSEYEKEKIRERTLRGRHEKARQGFIVGGRAPYGYRYVGRAAGEKGRYEIYEPEAEVVRLIFRWLADEKLSVRSIVCRLNAQGLRPQRGLVWGKSSVHRILTASVYIGETFYNRRQRATPVRYKVDNPNRHNKKTILKYRPKEEWIAVQSAAILDRELFEKAQAQLKKNSEHLSGANRRHFYLLRGLLYCGKCGRRLAGCPSHGRRYYRCVGRDRLVEEEKRCSVGIVSAERLEKFVWRTVVGILKAPEILIDRVRENESALGKQENELEPEVQRLEQILAKLGGQESRLVEAYMDEAMEIPALKAKLDEISAKKQTLKTALEKARLAVRQFADRENKKTTVAAYCRMALCGIDRLEQDGQQKLLQALLDKVVLSGNELEIHGILPLPSPTGSGKPLGWAGAVLQNQVFSVAANRPQREDVMRPRRRHLQRALCGRLPADVAEIRRRGGLRLMAVAIRRQRRELLRPRNQRDRFGQAPDAVNIDAFDYRRFGGILRGKDHVGDAVSARAHRHRKGAAHRPDGAIEREFTQHNVAVQALDDAHGAEDAHGHREVESGPFLADVGRREIDRDALGRIAKSGVDQGGLDALPAFANCDVRHSDHDRVACRTRREHVYFDIDQVCIDAINGRAECFEQRH